MHLANTGSRIKSELVEVTVEGTRIKSELDEETHPVRIVRTKPQMSTIPNQLNRLGTVISKGTARITIKSKAQPGAAVAKPRIVIRPKRTRTRIDEGGKSRIRICAKAGNARSKDMTEEPIKEKLLDNVDAMLLNTNATAIRRYLGGKFCCLFCEQQFATTTELKDHNNEEHDSQDVYSFVHKKRHKPLLVKLDITDLHCDLCKNKLENSIEQCLLHLQNHNVTVHLGMNNIMIPYIIENGLFHCPVCETIFSRFKPLQDHMNNHFPYHKCSICNAGFPVLAKLQIHQKYVHATGAYKCSMCPKVFPTYAKMSAHKKGVHLKIKRHRCGYCNESFSDNRNRDAHIESEHNVHVSSVICQACGRTFFNQTRLTRHMRKDHLMERPHKCSECDMAFFTKAQLDHHFVKHSGAKDFVCPYCSKAFGRRNTLREHVRIHEDDKRFKCEICDQAFVQNCSYKLHMRNKHGEIV